MEGKLGKAITFEMLKKSNEKINKIKKKKSVTRFASCKPCRNF